MGEPSRRSYVLGLDLGPNSVGWVVLSAEPVSGGGSLSPNGIIAAGSRVFEAGVTGDLESGKEESPAVARRTARLARRGLERRGRRLMVLYLRLAQAGLLPATQDSGTGTGSLPAARRAARTAAAHQRHEALAQLDRQLRDKWLSRDGDSAKAPVENQLLPYLLRAKALDERLDPHELGRALYHLGQRRGFLSNRKAPKKKDDEPGKVQASITEIEQGMKETNSRTLGEYFSRCDPFQRRVRERYTSRDLYKKEFEAIWAAQTVHHPNLLTDALKKQLHRAIFHQRPLKSARNLIGFCELESKSRRAPKACLEFQRFRLLQQVNNTRLASPDGVSRPFTSEERATLVAALAEAGDLTFKRAKTLLKPYGVNQHWTFNFEEGGESRFLGDRTTAKLLPLFGERWRGFSDAEREAVIAELLSVQRQDLLKRRAKSVWGLAGPGAEDFAAIELEDGQASLSRKALRKLLPFMDQWNEAKKQWIDTTTAKEKAGYMPVPREPLRRLPSLADAVKTKLIPAMRNPAITRTLSELRKVVNEVLRVHGKPEMIRVELGRDLRNPRDKREKMWRANRTRQKERDDAAKYILKEIGDGNPSRSDVEKVLLAEECGWDCPYTGKHISMASLLGQNPQFDVEHIIPFSRCLDDSFLNKTLCEVTENRSRKRDHTPWEAYGQDEARWEAILGRVKNFKRDATRAKLERFQTQDTETLLADFTSRQLNDTRYASRLAREYLSLLYGGLNLPGEPVKVQVAQGKITADLRAQLGIGGILRDGGAENKRDDHRHHAVDAVAIALTGPGTVQQLSEAAKNALQFRRRRYAPLQAPWEGFLEQVRAKIETLKVSHRPSHKVSGRLHEDTIYSPPKPGPDGKTYVHVRKRLDALSKPDLEGIVDQTVKAAVKAKLAEIGSDDPKKLDLEKNPPVLRTRNGGTVPIRKVRVRRPPSVFPVGGAGRERHVVSDANHHAEILEVRDKKDRVKWEGHVVSRFEAYRRLRAKEPVVRRDHGPDKRFLFTLAPTDTIELDSAAGTRGLYQVRSIWLEAGNLRLRFVPINDARMADMLKKLRVSQERMIEPLRKLNMRKVLITPLGEIRHAHD